MTKQEIISEINAKYNQEYKFNKSGRIYTEWANKKQWFKFDDVVSDWKAFEKERNADKNVKIASAFIESLGAELTYKSMYGARYYDYKGYKVRISDHDWTSEKHIAPDFNISSYEKDGHIGMIESIKNI